LFDVISSHPSTDSIAPAPPPTPSAAAPGQPGRLFRDESIGIAAHDPGPVGGRSTKIRQCQSRLRKMTILIVREASKTMLSIWSRQSNVSVEFQWRHSLERMRLGQRRVEADSRNHCYDEMIHSRQLMSCLRVCRNWPRRTSGQWKTTNHTATKASRRD